MDNLIIQLLVYSNLYISSLTIGLDLLKKWTLSEVFTRISLLFILIYQCSAAAVRIQPISTSYNDKQMIICFIVQ
jgi:hypothetical protein